MAESLVPGIEVLGVLPVGTDELPTPELGPKPVEVLPEDPEVGVPGRTGELPSDTSHPDENATIQANEAVATAAL